MPIRAKEERQQPLPLRSLVTCYTVKREALKLIQRASPCDMSDARFNDQIILARSLTKNTKLGALVGSLERKILRMIFCELTRYRSNDLSIIQRLRLSLRDRRDPIGRCHILFIIMNALFIIMNDRS